MTNLHSLPGPDDITRVELTNGIIVLARPNFDSPSIVLHGYLPAGSLFDTDEKLGLADFTALALMRGTQRRSFQQIFDTLESVGAGLGVDGGTHTAGFSGRALAEDMGLLLEMLAEVLRQPIFPPEHIERLRAQLMTSLAIRAQDTAEMASLAFDKLLYPDHPYSRPEDGYPETIQAITRHDIADFHHKHYGPRGMVIAVVGAVEPASVVKGISRVLGDWSNPHQPETPALPPISPLKATIRQQVHVPGKSQADIILGVIGPQRTSPDFLAASLGNSILGQFGLFGRIGQVVRDEAGLAYYASSSLSGGIGPGPWMASAGVDPENLDQAIELIRLEIARFVSEPVSIEELQDNQANYTGRLPLSLESNSGVAGALLNLERYELGLDYYRRYPDLIAAITPAEILEAAQRYLHPDRLAIATAGTFE
jgi:zinc protease